MKPHLNYMINSSYGILNRNFHVKSIVQLNGRVVMHLCGGWLAGWRLGWVGNEQGSVDAQDIPWADVM